MGFIAWRQRRQIIANTERIADALDGGVSVVNRQALARGAVIRQAEYDQIIARRCKKAGMTAEDTATFLKLGEEGRPMWSAAHPQYRLYLRY